MTLLEIIQLVLYFALLIACVPLVGGFMAQVFRGERTWLHPVVQPVEGIVYNLSGINPETEMTWQQYATALLLFNVFGFLAVLLLMLTQNILPLNPQGVAATSFPLSFNTAVSFMTNTNWQAYSGEAALSYMTQMLGLGVQNFVSAATGTAVIVALARAWARKNAATVGNFWADMTRMTLYVLLPLSLVLAVVLVSQGVVQSFSAYVQTTTLDGGGAVQTIPLGPAASQIAIKQLGTNGGGFFGVNSAHPFENPTPLSNFVQVFSILLLPAALTYTFGVLIGDKKQGWTIFAAMLAMLLVSLGVALWSEYQWNPIMFTNHPMEGKETRFGVMNSVLWSSVTTAASNGSVNAMHDSLSPLTGGLAMLNMMLGEVVFGGVGAGLYGMVMFVILTVFVAGLMVGRTPEYAGKKIEAFEVQMAMIAVLIPNALILCGAAIACVIPAGLSSLANKGPHGLSEILYAFTSAAANNGSAFAGLTVDTPFYNYALGFTMLLGRFGVILPALAIAGSVARKNIIPVSSGTLPTATPLFVVMLVAVIVIVGALTFFPALSLSPIVEHFLLQSGKTF
jgi:potassium-transporting ATPase potassium-binding subunit